MRNLQKTESVFQTLPAGFFNLLAGGSNQDVYSSALLLIYDQYEREISYRVSRRQIRDVLAAFLQERQVSLEIEDHKENNYSDLANALIRKMTEKHIGWLEEETDDTTLEKALYMTENGLALAEFLRSVQVPEQEEFSEYIIQIYQTLINKDVWQENPYINGIKSIHRAARSLSKSLKKLSTYIRKIIERMIVEETFESLTENLIDYFDGSFVKEYARLTRQQNVHSYRIIIRDHLEQLRSDRVLMERLYEECAKEEDIPPDEAQETVEDLFDRTKRFLFDEYAKIMQDITHKINVYLQVGIGRARFLRNRDIDERSYVERTIRFLSAELEDLDNRSLLPDEYAGLFAFDRHEYIDTASIRYPGKEKTITRATEDELVVVTKEQLDKTRRQHEKEAFNPYSKERAREYLDGCMDGRKTISAEELPIMDKQALMMTLSAVAYAKENGFVIRPTDGYVEADQLLLRRFTIEKGE